MRLYKTTVTVWTEYDPFGVPPHKLTYDATYGEGYISGKKTVLVDNPQDDPEFDGEDFFRFDEELDDD